MSALDRVSWSAGDFIVAGGRRYKINAGNTYSKLGVALPSSNGVASQKVIIYFDAKQSPVINVAGELSYEFSVRPATTPIESITVFRESSSNWKVGWAEYGSPKANWSLTFDITPTTTAGHPIAQHVTVPADSVLQMSDQILIDNSGITFNGVADIASDGSSSLLPNVYLRFKDSNNELLGNLGGSRFNQDTSTAPWFTGSRATDETSYSHFLWGVSPAANQTTTLLIQDMNRGIVNNLTALSQSVHTQVDGAAGITQLAEALDNSETAVDVDAGHGLVANDRISVLNQNSSTVWEEMLITNVSTNTLTVTRGYGNTTAQPHDDNAAVNKSWDNSGATSGARQHVRIPPNNAFTARTSSNSGPAESGWAYNSDIESNKLGPYALVLERSQSASTGQPDRPWNTQWRQLGAAFQNIEVSGQTTITAEKDSGTVNHDVLTVVGSGITITTNNSTKTITFATASSERYKENIEKLTLDTAKIYNLIPRTFTWKKDAPTADQGQRDFGLIAEEVAEIFPELTFNNAEGQIEGVKYITLSVILLAELKKLKEKVDLLESKEGN